LNWNLERGGATAAVGEAQLRLIDRLAPDIAVITEVPVTLSIPAPGRVLSPVEEAGPRAGESWTGILGANVEPAGTHLPFERMAAAATAESDGEKYLLFASVLPWMAAAHQARYLARHGESAADLFPRVLRDQVDEMTQLRALYPAHTLIWAGDFNQPLVGPNGGFSKANRQHLSDALDELSLAAWNQDLAHARPGYFSIDLICGPTERKAPRTARIEPVEDGVTLSDHAGYLIEI
jgi:hypothetical protein